MFAVSCIFAACFCVETLVILSYGVVLLVWWIKLLIPKTGRKNKRKKEWRHWYWYKKDKFYQKKDIKKTKTNDLKRLVQNIEIIFYDKCTRYISLHLSLSLSLFPFFELSFIDIYCIYVYCFSPMRVVIAVWYWLFFLGIYSSSVCHTPSN